MASGGACREKSQYGEGENRWPASKAHDPSVAIEGAKCDARRGPRGVRLLCGHAMFDWLFQLIHQLYDVRGLIEWGGLLMLTVIIFTETGLLFGFFLPGDSLLVTAGIFAAAGTLDLFTVLVVLSIAAVSGDQLGYWIGLTSGPKIFNREDSWFFHKRHAERAQRFYDRHGGKTIILARFIPIIRTFAPVVAGVGQMEYRRFVSFNVVGGVLWVWSMT